MLLCESKLSLQKETLGMKEESTEWERNIMRQMEFPLLYNVIWMNFAGIL